MYTAIDPARIAELNTQIDAMLADPDFDPNDEGEQSERYDALVGERDTLLVRSWFDDNGLLTGALAWGAANVKPSDSPALLWWDVPEGYCGGEVHMQVAVFCEKGGPFNDTDIITVRYQQQQGHYVIITPFFAAIAVNNHAIPYRIYRPVATPDGTIAFQRTIEVSVERFIPDHPPAYLGLFLRQCDQMLAQSPFFVDNENELATDDVYHQAISNQVLPEGWTTSHYDVTLITPDIAHWYTAYRNFILDPAVKEFSAEEFDKALDGATAALRGFIPPAPKHSEQLIVMSEDVEDGIEDIDKNEFAMDIGSF